MRHLYTDVSSKRYAELWTWKKLTSLPASPFYRCLDAVAWTSKWNSTVWVMGAVCKTACCFSDSSECAVECAIQGDWAGRVAENGRRWQAREMRQGELADLRQEIQVEEGSECLRARRQNTCVSSAESSIGQKGSWDDILHRTTDDLAKTGVKNQGSYTV